MARHKNSSARRTRRLNLPPETTRFVGRAPEIEELKRLLAATRLLTLTGAGGCGKTRLAQQVANEVQAQYRHGAVWVDLAPISDAALIPQALAKEIGVREAADQSLLATLRRILRSRQQLIVLDNCEHLLAACAQLVDNLLDECPNLTILATSREALSLAAETTWLVPSLSLPEPVEARSAADRLAALQQSDAVQLFVERAAALLPEFKLTADNAAEVWHITQRLDGMPLAIELAAARVTVMTVSQIAARLDDRFNLLTTGTRSMLPRHQTLRAAMDWSHELLSEKEQMLFRRLAVFAGSFTLDAAEAVGADGPAPEGLAAGEILDLLSRLIGKSLVVADTLRESEARYHLLETIRQYAWEKLRLAAEEPARQRRHHDWYLALAEQAEPELEGPQQVVWMDRLEADLDNLRAALDFSDAEPASRLRWVGALRIFWHLRGYWREGRERLARALAQASAGDETAAHAQALNGAGLLAWDQADYTPAQAFFQQSLALWRKLDDPAGIVSSLNYLGALAWRQGEYGAAHAALEEALALGRAARVERGVALALGLLGVVVREEGDYAAATELLEESIGLARRLGLKWVLADSLDTLGGVCRLQKQYARATALLEESLTISRELGNRWGLSFSLSKLGLVALDQRDYRQAARLFNDSSALQDELGDRRGLAQSIVGLARTALAQQQAERAACLLGIAQTLRQSIGAPLPPSDQVELEQDLANLRRQLSAAASAAAWARGSAMPAEQIVAWAAGEPAAPARSGTAELRLLALGTARAYRDGQLLTSSEWVYAKSRELLFYLLAHDARTKEQIGLDLWPEATPAQLRSRLAVTLHHLRHALGSPEWIIFDNGRYRFNRLLASSFWYDAEVLQTNLIRAQQMRATNQAEAIRLLEEAAESYQGNFLADMNAGDWYLGPRASLQRTYLEVLLSLGYVQFGAEHYASAAEAFRRAIVHDPYLEEAHRQLMRCYARMGELGQALRHYQMLADQMQSELQAQPAAETKELYERLRHGAPA